MSGLWDVEGVWESRLYCVALIVLVISVLLEARSAGRRALTTPFVYLEFGFVVWGFIWWRQSAGKG